MKYFGGCDVGSTYTKCVILDENGKIAEVKIFGDFFGVGEVSEIEAALCGKNHNETAIKEALAEFEIGNYFGKISEENLLEVLV